MLKLVIEDDEGRKTVVPFVREEITIGRQEGNTIRLTERNVSRRHARLIRSNGSVVVEDLGSYNGIRINGERIQGQVPITDSDLVQIGDYDLAIQHDTALTALPPPAPTDGEGDADADADSDDTITPPPRSNGAGAALAVPPTPPLPAAAAPEPSPNDDPEEASAEDVHSSPGLDPNLARRHNTAVIRSDQLEADRGRPVVEIEVQDAPRLVVQNTDLAGREFACIRSELKVGRTDENDIAIDHRSLSRTHAKVFRETTGEWRVVDLASANGLKVNGESYAQSTLRPGDVLELGHVKLRFVGAGEDYHFTPDAGGSRARGLWMPLLGVALALASLGGGAFWYLGRTPEAPLPAPPVNPGGLEKLARAKAAIEQLDWEGSAKLLEDCKLEGGALHPEAQTLLTQLQSETELRHNLQLAEEALAAGKLEQANSLLDDSAHTKLLAARYQQLRERWKAASDERLAHPAPAADPPPRTPEPPVKPPPDASKAAESEAQKLHERGMKILRAHSGTSAPELARVREARIILEKCIKAAPAFAPCHKALGITYARLQESEKGAYHYRKFLELAPNDPGAGKVRNILDEYDRLNK